MGNIRETQGKVGTVSEVKLSQHQGEKGVKRGDELWNTTFMQRVKELRKKVNDSYKKGGKIRKKRIRHQPGDHLGGGKRGCNQGKQGVRMEHQGEKSTMKPETSVVKTIGSMSGSGTGDCAMSGGAGEKCVCTTLFTTGDKAEKTEFK